jgi:epoxide hydrolase-like predicted phosphatase
VTRALIVDWGGVLTIPLEDAMRGWSEAEGMPYDTVMALLDWYAPATDDEVHIIHALERGESSRGAVADWLALQLRSRHDIHVQADGLIDRMFGHLEHHDAILDVCRQARAHGWRMAVLSNSWDNPYPRDRWIDAFDHVVISGEVGMRKPESRIFEYTLDLLGVDPEDALFLDDEEPNVLAARAIGMQSFLVRGHEAAAARVRSLFKA